LIFRDASNAIYGMYIDVSNGVEAELIVKGNVTLNSNNIGMYSFLRANTKLEINVENGSTLESCGNIVKDINGYVTGAATFSGTGYTCDQNKVVFEGDGTVDEPVCQDCS
jgi:hypothetical protein